MGFNSGFKGLTDITENESDVRLTCVRASVRACVRASVCVRMGLKHATIHNHLHIDKKFV